MKGFILYSTYETSEETTKIRLFGKLENGQSFAILSTINPYLYIKENELKKVQKFLKNFKTEKAGMKTFEGEPVIKIISNNQTELNKLQRDIHKEVKTYEADIKPDTRFMIDNDLLGGVEIDGEFEPSERIDRIYSSPKIKPAEFKPELKLASIDIESDGNSEKLFCVGIHSKDFKKTFFVTDKKLENVISCKTEEEALLKFREAFLKLDPDIVTGWSVIDFDLKYLEERFAKYKIPFDIGRTNEKATLRIEKNYFRSSSADIPGRIVLDGLEMIQDPFLQQAPFMRFTQFESYTLEDVSQAILGKGKLIAGESRHEEISKLYKQNTQKSHQALADYNLTDCKLVYDILEKTDVINLAIERASLTGMHLDKVTSSIASFDSLYIREANKRHLVSPTTEFGNKEERLKGGYVFSSGSGIYNNVLVLDFKSLYPSILCTFNIDPASHLQKKEKNAIESPNHEFFRNDRGILPEIIFKLHDAREKAKKEKRELASYAIKTIMNSFWGVLASPNCRYFNLGMGNAITGFARWIIQTASQEIEKRGYKVIYMDTDSVFVETKLAKEKANEVGKELQKEITSFYKTYLRENYNRESYLDLQFDKQFISMVIPAVRAVAKKGEEQTEEKAAKKRYAGLVEKNGKEELEITGLEAIRGDWTEAAREFQKELLMKLFKKESVEQFIKDYIKRITSGKLDSQLVYRKSLRKNVKDYTKTTPPHVKAARLLDKIDSPVIEYYITTEGPEPLQKLKHKIDYEHYIDKQITPIANQILLLLGKSLEDLKKGKQAKLF